MNRSTLVRLSRQAGLLACCFAAVFLGAAGALADPITVISRSTTPPGTGDGSSGVQNNSDFRWDGAGRFAVFISEAPDLVPGQNTSNRSVFLFDRFAGTTKLVSHVPGAPTTGPNGASVNPQISDDGSWVVFGSSATNLVSGQVDGNSEQDVFLWNRATDTTSLVSRAAGSPTTAGDAASSFGFAIRALSADGRFVAFSSDATNLVAGQIANGFRQVFQFDGVLGQTELVSHASGDDEAAANGDSDGPMTSADGRWVVFQSTSTNLRNDTTDTNAGPDVYLWDRDAGPPGTIGLQLLSRSVSATTTGNGGSFKPQISADGTGVVFTSEASNLDGVTTDTNGESDVFHFDVNSDALSLVSHRFTGPTSTGDGAAGAVPSSISADGNRVAFLSLATDHLFLQDDENGTHDVFLWQGGPITLVSHIPGEPKTTANQFSDRPLIAADGASVAFQSFATNLVAGQTEGNSGFSDVFLWQSSSATTRVVSHIPGDETQTGNSASLLQAVALNGGLIGFSSVASDLVSDDDNASFDVFFHDGTVLFADGFESGDTSAWSLVFP